MHREYQGRLRLWIAEALAQSATPSFSDLVCALPGVHPNDLACELKSLGIEHLKTEDSRIRRGGVTQTLRLPVPHPLDYDWRFTDESCQFLLKSIVSISGAQETVVLLGAPTLFRAAQHTALANRYALLDACPETVLALNGWSNGNVFTVDILRNALPNIEVGVVMADPPWYEEFAHAFLWAASQLVRLGGTVLLSTPPLGTRPGIDREWDRALTFAVEQGLEFHEIEQSLRYQSPPFERNALRAAGHLQIDPEWRPGLLARFVKVRNCQTSRPNVADDRLDWVEHSICGVRFRLRKKVWPILKSPMLVSVTDGDILNSVSRRDPRRANADVWTSGNRIFACEDTETLGQIVQAIAAGHRADTYVERATGRKLTPVEQGLVVRSAEQVATVISRELEEYVLAWEG